MSLLTQRMDIPQHIRNMINDVVDKDEGGWKLNPVDTNDQDGGWTFGGITSNVYNECFTTAYQRPIDRDTIGKVLSTSAGNLSLIEDCMQIYFRKVCVPLASLNPHSSLEINIPNITAMELSCFINVGEKHFLGILKDTGSQLNPVEYKKNFLAAWRNYYIHLVVENAKAWKLYAEYVERFTPEHSSNTSMICRIDKPITLRASYLAGWLARVDHYA